MSRQIGLVLRLLGPLIQIVALSGLTRRNPTLFGRPALPFIFTGFAIGFVMAITGVVLSRRGGRDSPRKRIDEPLNLR